ncbi:hypothetical protein CR513_43756, partial [Mucuna pruriens]
MADSVQTLFILIIVIVMVLAGCAITMYCLVTMILCNKKYSITAYQNALAKTASIERSTWVSHQIPAHKYEKKKHDDMADGDAHVCLLSDVQQPSWLYMKSF